MNTDIFQGIPLFINLSPEELQQVAQLMEVKGYLKGQKIFATGDPADAFYIISRGKIRIDIPRTEDRFGYTVFLKEGAFFGEMGVIQSSPRCADAAVEEDAILISIPKASFDRLLATNTDLSEKVMREYNQRVKQMHGKKEDKVEKKRYKTIVIYSAAGGAGTTLIACNVAKKIRDYTKKRVVLVDGDYQLGTTHVFLNCPTKSEIGRLVGQAEGQIDSLTVTSSTIALYENLDLIPAPDDVEDSEYFTAEVCAKFVEETGDSHPYVVVDTATNLDARNMTFFDIADKIIVVLEPQVCSTTRLASFFRLYKKLGIDQKKLLLVLNKCDEFGFDPKALDEQISTPIEAVIEYDRQNVMESLNKGKLLVDFRPDCDCGVSISNLARKLVSEDVPELAAEDKSGSGIFTLWGLLD